MDYDMHPRFSIHILAPREPCFVNIFVFLIKPLQHHHSPFKIIKLKNTLYDISNENSIFKFQLIKMMNGFF